MRLLIVFYYVVVFFSFTFEGPKEQLRSPKQSFLVSK